MDQHVTIGIYLNQVKCKTEVTGQGLSELGVKVVPIGGTTKEYYSLISHIASTTCSQLDATIVSNKRVVFPTAARLTIKSTYTIVHVHHISQFHKQRKYTWTGKPLLYDSPIWLWVGTR